MADSITDKVIPIDSWYDVATGTGIVAGSRIIIQNKGTTAIIMWIGSSSPSANSKDGPIIFDIDSELSVVTVSGGQEKVWLKSSGSITGLVNIQDLS